MTAADVKDQAPAEVAPSGAVALDGPPPAQRSRRRGLLVEWLPLTLFYSLLGCVLTWPLVTRMSSGMYGFGNDNFGGMFFVKWIHTAFWGPERAGYSPDIAFPYGFEIDDRYISPYDRVVSIALGGIGDGLFAYNAEILVSFVFAGLTMYALARYLTGSRPAALVAGIIFAASPFHLAMSMQYPAMASIQWAPLVVLAVIHVLRTRRLRDAALLGVAMALMWATSYYYGWFAIWWVGAMVVAYGLVGLWRAARARRAAAAVRDGARFVVTRGSVAVLTAIVITLPMVLPLVSGVLSDPGKYARSESDLLQNAVRPWQFVLPPPDNVLFGDQTADVITRHLGILPVYEQNVYLGVIPSLLVLLALVLYRRAAPVARAAILPLLAASAFFVVLMLGPELPYRFWVIGDWLSPTTNPHFSGPVKLLYEVSANFRYYGRTFVFVSVALALLAALGLALALRRWSGARRWVPWAVAAVVGALVVTEFFNDPDDRFVDLRTPTWVKAVEKLPEDASIMNYPAAGYSTPRSLFYTYWQTRHERRTVNPPETQRSEALVRSADDPDSFLAGQTLSRAGVDYAVMHTKLPSPTFPPYQPPYPDDSMPRDAGARNPWLRRVAATPDAVIYAVRDKPTYVGGAVVGFGAGWGEPEGSGRESWRWMRNEDSKLTAFAAKTYRRAVLTFAATSFSQPRRLELRLDGKRIFRGTVPPDGAPLFKVPIRLTKGSHEIAVHTDPGTQSIDETLHNGDLRGVAIRVRQPQLTLKGR